MFMLKARRPERFREHVDMRHSGAVPGAVLFTLPDNGRDGPQVGVHGILEITPSESTKLS